MNIYLEGNYGCVTGAGEIKNTEDKQGRLEIVNSDKQVRLNNLSK